METHMIFETHAHYDDEAFEAGQRGILEFYAGTWNWTVLSMPVHRSKV